MPLLHSYKFIPAFDVTPVEKGVLGDTYLNHLRRIVGSIVPRPAQAVSKRRRSGSPRRGGRSTRRSPC